MVPNWKITAEYDERIDCWDVAVWMDETRTGEPGSWRCVAAVQQASLEASFFPQDRIRQILRQLGANPVAAAYWHQKFKQWHAMDRPSVP